MLEQFTAAAPSSEIFKKNDPADLRLGDFTRQMDWQEVLKEDPKNVDAVILGYPDDLGIKMNGGRAGASEAPAHIRRHFYKMTPSPFSKERQLNIIDVGNIVISEKNTDLQSRHEQAQEIVGQLLAHGFKVCTLGGGHDYGFPDYSAFCEATFKKKLKPFIINFDAHLDVRTFTNQPHSGNPFFQLLEKYSERIIFYEIGIQDWCNSRTHLQWLRDHKGQVISLAEIMDHSLGLTGCLEEKIISISENKHALGLSVCMDAFSSAFSPGASQVFPLGLEPYDFLRSLKLLCKKFKPPFISFYETSPPFDHDDRTVKLTAILMHQWLSENP